MPNFTLGETANAGFPSSFNLPTTSELPLATSDQDRQAIHVDSSASILRRQSEPPCSSGENPLKSEQQLNRTEEKTSSSTLPQVVGAEQGDANPRLGDPLGLEAKLPAQKPSPTSPPQNHRSRLIAPIIADHIISLRHLDEPLLNVQAAGSVVNPEHPAFTEFHQAIEYLDKIENGTFFKSETYEDMVRWIKMWTKPSSSSKIAPDSFVGSLLYRPPDGSPDEPMDMDNLKMEMLSEMTGTAVMPKDAWSLRVMDAMLYLEMVKTECEKKPQIYSQLLELLKDTQDKTLEIPDFLERVSILFEGHPTLVIGIKHFVPPEPQTSPPIEENAPADTAAGTEKQALVLRENLTTLVSQSKVIPSEEESLATKLDVGSSITWISTTALKVNGHFCDVYEGTHVVHGKVALKRPRIGGTGYDEEISRRFEREAATWQNLGHPNILEFIGTLKRDGHLYFVSPFIKNGTLVEYLLAHPDSNRIKLLFETAGAVNHLHMHGVVHGDIKASNILINDDGRTLLCDFGLAKTADSMTSTAMKGAGTFRWQSPELWEDKPRSFQSDIYAFGMTIAEVLKGEIPFAHFTNNSTVMRAVLWDNERPSKKPTSSPTGISYSTAWSVAEACWAKNPQERIPILEVLVRIRRDPSLGYLRH